MRKFFCAVTLLCSASFMHLPQTCAYGASSGVVDAAGIRVKDGFSCKYDKLPKNVVFAVKVPLSGEFSSEITSCPDEWTVLSYDADRFRVKLSNVSGGIFDLFRNTAKIKIKPLAAGRGTLLIKTCSGKTVTFIIDVTADENNGGKAENE